MKADSVQTRKASDALLPLNPRAASGNKLAHKVAQFFGDGFGEQYGTADGVPGSSIKVDDWLRGEPLMNFQAGRLYIVKLWATWCGPFAMPLWSSCQKYRDSGLEVVGVAADEYAPTAVEARTKLDAWLTEKCSNLNFRIGFDYTGEMNKLWMEPSFSVAIPTSFVVDRDGHIDFIGHPAELDDVLPKVLNGIWSTSAEAKAARSRADCQDQRTAREQALKKPIYAKLQPAMQAEDLGGGALGDRGRHRPSASTHRPGKYI